MSKRVYITRQVPQRAEQVLREGGCEVEVSPHDRPLTQEEMQQAAAGADGMLCLLNNKISGELMDAAPRCKVYANYAVGYDNMDVQAATERGIALSNTPDVLTGATAELAWALLFAAARRLGEGERMVRAGKWTGWAPMQLLGFEVLGKTLGIIGAGRIGSAMAHRARGFDMRILYIKGSGRSAEMDALGAHRVTLEELLQESDFVSVHAPLNAGTRHLLGAEQLKMMKPTAILVNTGRGPVIDEAALATALAEGQIAAAGLDVYEREPVIEPRLFDLENVVLAPHLGSATYEARDKMAELAARNLLDFFAGHVPRTCINPEFRRP